MPKIHSLLFVCLSPIIKVICTAAIFQLIMAFSGFCDTSTTVLDTVTIRAEAVPKHRNPSLTQMEFDAGLADDLGDLLFQQKGISRVPESVSQLLIRSGGPYDNRFLVYDVPMWAPSHFAGFTWAERFGLIACSLERIGIELDGGSSRHSGALGGTLSFEPKTTRFAPSSLKKRPELVVDLGSLESRLLLSFPFRQGKDLIQITNVSSWDYFFTWNNNSSPYGITLFDEGLATIGSPLGYNDLMLTLQTNINTRSLIGYAWLGMDRYDAGTVPWGMCSFSLDSEQLKIRAGFSRQTQYESKILGTVIPTKEDTRSTVTIVSVFAPTNLPKAFPDITFRATLENYRGSLRMLELDTTGVVLDGSFNTTSLNRREELNVGTVLQGHFGDFSFGSDLLGRLTFPRPQAFLDPTAWIRHSGNIFFSELRISKVVSFPDVRGFPSTEYFNQPIRTYNVCLRVQAGNSSEMLGRLDAELYGKYTDRYPRFSNTPGMLLWDERIKSELGAGGLSVSWINKLNNNISCQFIQDLSRARRLTDGSFSAYEWDVPWTTKAVLHLHHLLDRMHWYFTLNASAGLLYRELIRSSDGLAFEKDYRRMKNYRRIDFKWQYNQPVENHRYLTRFDAFVEFNNIGSFIESAIHHSNPPNDPYWDNIREYGWQPNMEKVPIVLEKAKLHLGLRIGFRL